MTNQLICLNLNDYRSEIGYKTIACGPIEIVLLKTYAVSMLLMIDSPSSTKITNMNMHGGVQSPG